MATKRRARKVAALEEREHGFNLNTAEKLPEYNALFDESLRHYFENKKLQKHLYQGGLIDREGRVVDLDKNKGKLQIIEQEFKKAEKEEELRMKEEAEIRTKRHEALEKARKVERMIKLKEDRKLRREIVKVGRGELLGSTSKSSASLGASRASRPAASRSQDGTFFMTGLDSSEYAADEGFH